MDFGAVLSGIATGIILTSIALYAIAAFTSFFGGAGAAVQTAALVCGAVGLVMQLISGMCSTRSSDTSMQKPPELSQPPGFSNPNPGGSVPFNPNPGLRPPVSQFPPAPGTGDPVAITLQGTLSLAGQLGGPLSGGGGLQLGVEAGDKTAPVPIPVP